MVKKEEMQAQKITVIKIQPATNVRSTQGDRWLFSVSDEYLEEYDAKKMAATGKMGGNARRKRQLEKYNAYKEEIRWWAAQNSFQMPTGYFAIWFYVPAPVSWRKKKRAEMIGKPHMSTPDCDNLLKAFFDGIMPRKNKTKQEKGSDDRRIHCYVAFKVWVEWDDACIKVLEYNEEDFLDAFVEGAPSL